MNDVARDRNAAADESKRADTQSGSQKRRALVAVDLGAESCRVSLLRWVDAQPEIELAHRFANSAADDGNGLRWDIRAICEGVEAGLQICAQLAPEGIAAIGVDGWSVDYVRLRPDGQPIASPFCYRDERTIEAQKRVHSRISPERLYGLTGVQILSLNTLYQLAADHDSERALPWINVPEFVMHGSVADVSLNTRTPRTPSCSAWTIRPGRGRYSKRLVSKWVQHLRWCGRELTLGNCRARWLLCQHFARPD